MSVADKIGLFPFAGWMAGHGFVLTLLLALLVSPGMMFVLALIGESRWLPVSPDKQFLSFIPGDLFLAGVTALLLEIAKRLPAEQRWYNSSRWHLAVLLGALLAACVMTWLDYKSGLYPRDAILSPTKCYHNFALYAGYGYLIVATLVAVAAGVDWMRLLAALLALAVLLALAWGVTLWLDNRHGVEGVRRKAAYAHVADWQPIWKTWRIRSTED